MQEAELWVLLKSKGVRLDETRPEPAQAKLAVQLLLGSTLEITDTQTTATANTLGC